MTQDINWKNQLKERTDLTEEEIETKIQEKITEFNGLVSKEAAPILIARDYNLDLIEQLRQQKPELEIKNIVPGMRSFTITGHVHKVKDEYNPYDEDYRVTSVILEDDSGKTEVSFWNEDSDQAQKLTPGLKLEIINAYTKEEIQDYQENRYGVPGVNLSDSSKVTVYNNKGDQKTLIDQ